MTAGLFSILRTLAQFTYGFIAAALVSWGLPTNLVTEGALLALFVAITTAALRYGESRTGNTWHDKLLRWIARAAMFGLSSHQPVYAPPASPGDVVTIVGYSDGTVKSPL